VRQGQQLLQHHELEIDMQEFQRQEQELRFEAKKQDQRKAEMELQKYDIELQRQKQELQDAIRDSEFQAKKRDKQLAHIIDESSLRVGGRMCEISRWLKSAQILFERVYLGS
jgi:hypothetical protein